MRLRYQATSAAAAVSNEGEVKSVGWKGTLPTLLGVRADGGVAPSSTDKLLGSNPSVICCSALVTATRGPHAGQRIRALGAGPTSALLPETRPVRHSR